jgi:hypothetical protein
LDEGFTTKSFSEPAMAGLETNQCEEIDGKTSRSIRDAVGERLQQSLPPHVMPPAPQLDRLVEEMRRRERNSGASAPRPDRGGFFR